MLRNCCSLLKESLAFFVFLFFATYGLVGTAQNQQLEEVVIQAERNDSDPIDDLASIVAFDGEKLADAGIENVEDVAAYTPNFNLTQTETGTNIFIRGIGAGVNQGFDQSVGLYSDGVPLPRGNMARAPFLDLASVQILRGPQYVLDGNYSIAGSAHMISNLNVDEFKANVDFNFIPSQNERKLLLSLGGPINDQFAANVVLQSKTSDGFVENVFRSEDGPAADELLVRFVFGYRPTENLNFTLKVEQGSFDTTGRAAEVVFAGEGVPDIGNLTAVVNGDNESRSPRNSPAGLPLPTALVSPDEFRLIPRGNGHLNQETAGGDLFFFSGRDYFTTINDLYNDNAAGLNGFSTSPLGAQPVPLGFNDTEFDFRRGADADERSENDSLNITLNTELSLGDHRLKLTNSFVEYDYDELIDADFTSLAILEVAQQETYEQSFHKLEFHSSKGNFVDVVAGVSYLSADLSFNDLLSSNTINQERESPLPTFNPNSGGVGQTLGFDPDAPFGGFLSRSLPAIQVESLAEFDIDRIFEQEQETVSAYFQTTFNWSDSFRSTLGARYTRSEKDAVRDLVLVNQDGNVPTLDDVVRLPGEVIDPIASRAIQLYQSVFAIQIHTDRFPQLFDDASFERFGPSVVPETVRSNLGVRTALGGNNPETNRLTGDLLDGNRREEQFLPSLTLEWDALQNLSFRASVRLANKLGGFDARSNATPNILPGTGLPIGSFEFEDEEATSYEFGLKWFWGGAGAELNATYFFTDYKDLQTSTSDGRAGLNVGNAGAARTQGVEIEGFQPITEKLSLNYSLSWIDFEFLDFINGSCRLNRRPDNFILLQDTRFIPSELLEVLQTGQVFNIIYPDPDDPSSPGFRALSPINGILQGARINENIGSFFNIDPAGLQEDGSLTPETLEDALTELRFFDSHRVFGTPAFCDFEGQTNQFVSDWNGTFSFNYETEIPGLGLLLQPSLDIIYNSGYFTNLSQDEDVAQDEYFQFNGRLALTNLEDSWEIALTGQNLTNERILSYSQDLPIASAVANTRSYFGFSRPPRSIGLNFRYKFH